MAAGRLWWAWQDSMKGEEMARIWGAWAEDYRRLGVGRGRRPQGGGHAGRGRAAGGAAALCARTEPGRAFFRELRRAIEGKVPDLQAKQDALAEVLNAWQADPARVQRLCGWDWLRKALKDLPAKAEVIQA